MAAFSYALKYASKVDERFAVGALTTAAINNDYDWLGVNAVNVYSIPTVQMGDYTASGANRYGSPSEIGGAVQTLTLSKDRAFTFTVDKIKEDDTNGAYKAGEALRREIDEVVIPEIDKYRLTTLSAAAATNTTAAALTTSTVYAAFLAGCAHLTDNGVPATGRIAFVKSTAYNLLKQDSAFVKASDVAQNMLINNSMGMVDGVQIIVVPTSYMPAKRDFIICHPSAMVSPVKLEEYKIHTDAPGISGSLIEGRVRYDAFVLDNKASKAVYAYKNAD